MTGRAWTGRDLTILVPMLGRPHHITPLLASITASTPGARVLFLCSPDDTAVHQAVDASGRDWLVIDREPVGDYARKINTGYRNTSEPLLFTGASDLFFHHGWFEAATAQLRPGIGVVGTNDLGNPAVLRGEHATHFLVTRDYADQHGTVDGPGQVMAEVYPHEWVDTEMVATARHRGAWAMALDSRVEHLHPNWRPEIPSDPMYGLQAQRMDVGKRTFDQRRHLWAG